MTERGPGQANRKRLADILERKNNPKLNKAFEKAKEKAKEKSKKRKKTK